MKADYEFKEYRVYATPPHGKRPRQFKKDSLEESVACKEFLEQHGWKHIIIYYTQYIVAYYKS